MATGASRPAAHGETPRSRPDRDDPPQRISLSVTALRVLLFGVLPLLLAVAHVWLDDRVRHRAQRLEVFMLYVLAVGVAGSAIGGVFSHALFLGGGAAAVGGAGGENPSA